MNQESYISKWDNLCRYTATHGNVDPSQFNAIIERVTPQGFSDGFIIVTVENSFIKNWLERDFLSHIKKASEELYGMPFTIMVEIDGPAPSSVDANAPAPVASQSAPQNTPSGANESIVSPLSAPIPDTSPLNLVTSAPITSNPSEISRPVETRPVTPSSNDGQSSAFRSLTFESFITGDSNQMAYSMALQVAENPGMQALNPLFIYGASGLGKTHLMRAIQNNINETRPDLVTIYTDTEEVVNAYVDAVSEANKEKSSYRNFKDYYEGADVLLIDDIQVLQGKEKTLDIIFQIFNKLISQGKQIVLSADRAPKNIDIDERYNSRFMQGGVVDIQPPEVETKLAIVKNYIKEYKSTAPDLDLDVSEDVQLYIAENSGSNIRELKGAVTKLLFHLQHQPNKEITKNEVEALLDNYFIRGMSRDVTIDDVQKNVEEYYKIRHSDMVGSSRSREVVLPRQMAMYLCRQLLDKSFSDIGKKFNRDHTTVMHSVSKVESLLLQNRDVQEEIESLSKRIKEL